MRYAVLKDVSTQLVNMLVLVLKILPPQVWSTDFLQFPLFVVVDELPCNKARLASSFDYVFNLGFMYNRVVNSVFLTVFNANVFQNLWQEPWPFFATSIS